MKKLILNSSQIMEADKIVKNERIIEEENGTVKTVYDIFGYNKNVKEWSFYNLSEYMFKLEDGQEWDLSEDDMLLLAIAELDMQREIDKTETQLAIAELAETILGGM